MADDDEAVVNKDYLYELLGCDELSTEEQIIAEYKIKAKRLHPDKSSGNKETTEEFIRLNKAKEILCNKEQRKKYDFWRRSGLAISFDMWLKTDKCNHMSVHWAPKPKKKKMIVGHHNDSGTAVNQDNTSPQTSTASRNDLAKDCDTASRKSSEGWERRSSWGDSKLNKFRNYMI